MTLATTTLAEISLPMSETEQRGHADEPLMLDRISMDEFSELTSSIPPQLMSKLTEEQRYLFETVSRIMVQNEWLARNQIRHNESLRAVIKKMTIQETWRVVFMNKWGLVTWLATIILTIFVAEVGKRVFDSK